MSESSSKTKVIFEWRGSKTPSPDSGVIPPSSLKSKRVYTCASHPNKEAFCLCAKCGKYLCSNCALALSGRRYCESCLMNDDGLRETFEREFFTPRIVIPQKEDPTCNAPVHIKEFPGAILNMIKDSNIFFKTAKDASFPLSFVMACIALVPTNIYNTLYKLGERPPKEEPFKQLYEYIQQLPTSVLVANAIFATFIQVLILDLAFFVSLRVFARSQMSYTQAGSLMHFCILPMIFGIIGVFFANPAIQQLIPMLAMCLMIIQTITAMRSATQCTLMQSFGAMISFILLASLSGAL